MDDDGLIAAGDDGALRELFDRHAPWLAAWRLLYVEDRPVAEVARLMGVSEGTVKSRPHRARRLLRAALRSASLAEEGIR